MFSGIKKFIGYIGVEETPTRIIVDGIPGSEIMRDIQTKWQTSKINSYLFILMTRSKIVFGKFFAVDVLYILNELYADPKTRTSKRILRKLIDELTERTWLKDIGLDEKHNRLNFSKLSEISFKMLPHQMEFLESYNRIVPSYRLNGMLLAAAPGSGKTLTGLALASCLESDVVIMIVPKNSLERVWEATLRDNLVLEPKYWVSKTLGESAPEGLRYYAFHYEALDRAMALADSFSKKTKVCIILDECHNFNEVNSTRTQLFLALCKKTNSKDVLWSSGTPIKALGAEAIPLLCTIDPYFNDKDTEVRFKKIFGRDANKANDILRNRIGLVSFKVVKKDVVKGEVNYITVKVKLPNSAHYTLETIRLDMSNFIDERMKYYNANMQEIKGLYDDCLNLHASDLSAGAERTDFELYKKYIKLISSGYDARTMQVEVMYCNKYELQKIIPGLPDLLKKQFKSARSVIKYLTLKVMGEALGGVLGKRRSQCHVDMINYLNLEHLVDQGTKKTVIFTSYVEVVDKVAEYMVNTGYEPIKVYGDTNKHLGALIGKFSKDESVNPLIATYQSLSTAVPLIMANNMIMLNAPFRDHEREQAIARCDRLGQDSPVTVYDVYLDTGDVPNISTRSKDILEWSRAAVASIMGVSAPEDLVGTLESMSYTHVSLEASQEAFFSTCRKVLE
jgi:SNF2 family DNA or RNA helicase